MTSFALRFTQPARPDAEVPYSYDAAQQMSVLPGGRLAAQSPDVLAAAGTTTSTAGSQTHFDD